MKKLGRILGAAVLAVIASMFVNACTLLLFGGTAYTIHNLSFMSFIAYSMILSLGCSVVMGIGGSILYGLWYLSRGSKLIGAIVIIVLLNGFINEYGLLIADIPNGPAGASIIKMIKEEAGSYYMLGAIITLIIDFLSYVVCSAVCFIKSEDSHRNYE